MDSSNRISSTVSIARQTPKNDFGDVLNNTLSGAIRAGGALANAVPGMPILSAAVSSVQALANSGPARSTVAHGASGTVTLGSNPGGMAQVGGSGAYGSVGGVRLGSAGGGIGGAGTPSIGGGEFSGGSSMVSEMARVSEYYMGIQNEMQQESRAYNTLSNVIKVRHDSAKAAINNIR